MNFDPDVVGRLAAAVALGAAIGFEREAADQPAGLRTHISVALGASLFGIISTLGFNEFVEPKDTTNVQVDVTRVASQVVVGIGFIGAGMIFRQGGAVKNLTTAASLWVTCAIGLAAGVGDIGTALVATAALLLSLVALRPLRTYVRQRLGHDDRQLRITLALGTDPTELAAALHALEGVSVGALTYQKDDGAPVIDVALRAGSRVDIDERLRTITGRSDVSSLVIV